MKVRSGMARGLLSFFLAVVVAGCMVPAPASVPGASASTRSQLDQVLLGRQLVIQHGCGDCHGGGPNPAALESPGPLPGLHQWLAGSPGDTLPVGGFRAWPRNLTADDETGIGRYSERQIFNALRYGLRPSATPDADITSAVPGQGNHPTAPKYLSPAMPWLGIRTHSDAELRAIAAYLKRGVRPFRHRIRDSEAPPDFWASEVSVAKVGTHVLPAFPTQYEQLHAPDKRDQILRGRQVVVQYGCGLCHGGGSPDRAGWLAGLRDAPTIVAPYTIGFPVGEFTTRPRNLTPDNSTGLGRFTERQIFNALRFGLRPGETPNVEITSTVPGQGNFPANPKYLAPPMPWPAWRHMPDADLWAIAAYLKHGVKPVSNRVADSEGPPDFWAGLYTPENWGTHPAPAFPTANERAP